METQETEILYDSIIANLDKQQSVDNKNSKINGDDDIIDSGVVMVDVKRPTGAQQNLAEVYLVLQSTIQNIRLYGFQTSKIYIFDHIQAICREMQTATDAIIVLMSGSLRQRIRVDGALASIPLDNQTKESCINIVEKFKEWLEVGLPVYLKGTNCSTYVCQLEECCNRLLWLLSA